MKIALLDDYQQIAVQSADWIVVLDSGRIVEQGTHAELLQRGGHYRRLYELQFTA